MSNIADVVAADKNLTVPGKGIKAAGREEILTEEGLFTVLASTDLIDIDGARIQGRYMTTSNGVVHSLDRIVSLN